MNKKIFLSMAALFGAAILGFGQQLPSLPNDPATRVGKLDNGLTYYIRHNDKPAQRAEFYLATNVGAIQETPDQRGLAHFLEHMCFNGTKNFPEKGILNWLESIGASFGGNVNASTGVEQTIYLLNNIPLSRPGVVDTCILIMHDYSHFVTCDPSEIDKERGVIVEEKRSRNNASWRMFEQSAPYLYGDTKYAGCNIIGSEEGLKTFKPESLTNFYHTWYHPDMQALIVVGDINVDEVEAKIKSTFADIPATQNPQAKEVINIPANPEPAIGILTDPELNNTSIEVYWRHEPVPEEMNNTAVRLMTDLVQDIIGIVMNERLSDIAAKPDAPFLYSNFGIGSLCETSDATICQTATESGKILPGFEASMTEIEKMRRFGFTDAEIERAKTEVLSQYESAAKKADTRKNGEFVMPMVNNFFDNKAFMDPKTEYEYVQSIMPQIQPEVINQLAGQLITHDNMVVLYEAPKQAGITHPSEADIKAVITKVENEEIAQAKGEEIPTAFLDPSTLKGSAVKKTEASIYDSEAITLKNGVKVILLPTSYEKDKISFNIYKKGGESLISDADLYSFDSNIWSLYIQNTGVSDFPATTVSKMLSGKQVRVQPYVGAYTHGISGTSTKKDLETALQLAYLYYTAPRFDANEYNQGRKQIEAVLPNLMKQSNYKLQDAVYKTLYKSPRKFLISDDVLAKASLGTLEKNYKALFNDAAGAVMVVVGDFDKTEMLPLIEKYAGSLPKGKKATNWAFRNDGVVQGQVTNDFKAEMETPMVTVAQVYNIEQPYTVQNDVNYSALSYILDMIYTDTLREDEGGTYGASTSGDVSNAPYEDCMMQVVFQTNVESADKLRALAIKGFKGIAENGPTAEQFDKTVKNLEKNIPESKLRNAYWSSAILKYEKYGFDYISEYEAAVKALTPAMIQATAKQLIDSGNFTELVMRPADKAE